MQSDKPKIQPEMGSSLISELHLKNNLYYLASPEMEGRETTKKGQKLAARFLESEMIKYGVLPAGDNGTYFQNFMMDVSGVDQDSTYLNVNGRNYRFGKDYASFPTMIKPFFFTNAEVVFVGYGLKNDSLKIDDFKGKYLKGKWVVVASGFPKGYPTRSNPRDANGSFAKRAEIMKLGAMGVINLPNKASAKQLEVFGSYFAAEQMKISDMTKSLEEINKPAPSPFIPVFGATKNFASDLLGSFGLKADEIFEALEVGNPLPTVEKTVRMSGSFKKYVVRRETQNVVGYIPGVDAQLKKTFVSMGAHYDHMGLGSGGEIFYGADDDGSGTVVTLETMRVFAENAKAGKGTKRSLLFAFHTGEEKGLLGSNYLTQKGLKSIMDSVQQIIANVNIDMVGREHVDTLEVVGHDRLSTDFYNAVEEVNKDMKLFTYSYTYNNPNDPADVYKRSDHYNYAKKGIPIVFFTDGMGENWQKGTPKDDYHKPTDTPDKIDYKKLYKVTQLSYELIKRTANSDKAPVVDKK